MHKGNIKATQWKHLKEFSNIRTEKKKGKTFQMKIHEILETLNQCIKL